MHSNNNSITIENCLTILTTAKRITKNIVPEITTNGQYNLSLKFTTEENHSRILIFVIFTDDYKISVELKHQLIFLNTEILSYELFILDKTEFLFKITITQYFTL